MSEPGTQYSLFENLEQVPVEPLLSAPTERRFSDYVVYVDESGDHSLASIDAGYPVFVLALCIFHKRHYAEKIIPAVEKLKFNYFGHDSVVLHETDIRKQRGDFAFLSHKPTYEKFMAWLSSIMAQSNFILIACVVDKGRLGRQEGEASNPYHIALDICLQRLHDFLAEKGQEGLQTHVVVECRGKKEDRELELEFRRICDGKGSQPRALPFSVVFADKKTNLAGLQVADLVARPVGLSYLRPEQTNLAFETLKKKFFCDGGRDKAGSGYENVGLVVHPTLKEATPSRSQVSQTPMAGGMTRSGKFGGAQKAKGPGEPTEARRRPGTPNPLDQ